MTANATGSPTVVELPPLQEGRLYSADETSQYVLAKAQWLKRELKKEAIPGGYLGRTPCWTADDIRELIQLTRAPQKREPRGGGATRRSQRLRTA
ncbi:hypothetical protein [Streptomyces youssoufiensis]